MKNKKNLKKLEASGIIIAMVLGAFVSAVVQGGQELNDILLSFSFPQPVITQVLINGTPYDQVTMEGLPQLNGPGVPLLPVKPVQVLLPQGREVESVDVTWNENISLGTGFHVEAGSEFAVIGSGGAHQINQTINFSRPFPTTLVSTGETYFFRGYGIFVLNVYPIHYLGANGNLYYYPEMTVTIHTQDNGVVNPFFRGRAEDELLMRLKVDDASKLSTYVSYSRILPFHSSFVDPLVSFDYVIITSQALKNLQGPGLKFQDLANYKTVRGIRTTIVTVEEIYGNYPGDDDQEKIRNFIRDAYVNWGIEYVLLGGDHDGSEYGSVPARHLYVDVMPIAPGWFSALIPSDLYYACLDGPYDYNNDNQWGEPGTPSLGENLPGEPGDGEDGGDVDLLAEVYIGRACVDNAAEVSNFVGKTLSFEATVNSYLKNVWMVGEYLGFGGAGEWGGNYKDEIIDGSDKHGYTTVGIPSDEYNIGKLYDRDWPGHDWPKSEIILRINTGTHIINHLGHAWYNKNMKMFIEDIDDLLNDKYCFIYSQGCMAGGFDNPEGYDCIAEGFTVETSHGAFAGIWNSREGFGADSTDGPSQRYDRWFFDGIYNASQSNYKMGGLGAANQYSKEKNLYLITEDWDTMSLDEIAYCRVMRWCYYELNLFGDPQVELKPAVVPAQDIRVNNIQVPKFVIPNEQFTVHGYILNKGASDVTNVRVTLKVDGTPVNTSVISQVIERNTAAVISFDRSLPYGLHEISIEAEPLPNENITNDNTMCIKVPSTNPPGQPSTPEGSVIIKKYEEYTFTTSSVDLDGDSIYYLWDWGDETESDWLGPYPSGEIVGASHTWTKIGGYSIKVRAKDVFGALSNWSHSKPIVVSYDIPPCFLVGTKVTMTDGSYKNIENIKVGDIVKSYDRINQRFSGATVTKVSHHSADEMGDYYLVINKELRVTPNHLLLINGEWTSAGKARIGSYLFSVDGSNILIKSIEKVYKKVPTYNFETALIDRFGVIESGTYFAEGSMVHTQKNVNLIKNIEQWMI